MKNLNKRRSFKWSRQARELVKQFELRSRSITRKGLTRMDLEYFLTRLVLISGNPRSACLRFLRRSRDPVKRRYQQWTEAEKQRLLSLTERCSLQEIATTLKRSEASIRSMLYRLGAEAQMGSHWCTPRVLAQALGVTVERVQMWINRGWLKTSTIRIGNLTRNIIHGNDLAEFCNRYRPQVVCNRLSIRHLDFVQSYVFPPDGNAVGN